MNRTHFRILDTLSRCLGAQPVVEIDGEQVDEMLEVQT